MHELTQMMRIMIGIWENYIRDKCEILSFRNRLRLNMSDQKLTENIKSGYLLLSSMDNKFRSSISLSVIVGHFRIFRR